MANPFFFGSPRGAGFEFLSDVAAAERQVDAYFAQLHSQPTVPPEGAAAFALTSEQAVEAYTRWLNSLSFVPGGLKRFADLDASRRSTSLLGRQRHDPHDVPGPARRQPPGDGALPGRPGQRAGTRQIAGRSGVWPSARSTHYFENVLISGKDALPPGHVTLLTPPEADPEDGGLRPRPAHSPHRALHHDPRAAFTSARTEMEAKIRKLVAANIGGDQQQVDSSQTRLRRRVGAPRSGSLLPGDLQIPGRTTTSLSTASTAR